jgi:peroxiredoxin
MTLLSNGQMFPSITLPAVGGGTLALPRDLAGAYGVVLIYRGSWCPYCNAQLSGFQRAAGPFAELGIKVAALSVDDEPTSRTLVEKLKLGFAIGHSAPLEEISRATGAFVNDSPRHFQTTGFVLDPAGRVVTAVYSSGAIGRLVADDVAGLVRYLKSRA